MFENWLDWAISSQTSKRGNNMKQITLNNEKINYCINTEGQVYSLYTNKFLTPSISEHGYAVITLSINRKKVRQYIHRLMAYTYLDFNKNSTKVINHKDGNKLNNKLDNLEIISSSENLCHTYNNHLRNTNKNKKCIDFNQSEKYKNEIWKTIDGYDGDYEISNYGRIKSLKYNKPILLRQDIRCGYYSVVLSCNGKTKHFQVHDLVFRHFSEEPKTDDGVIDHIDGDKLNNHINNLRLVSQQDNLKAATYEQKLIKTCKPIVAYKNGAQIGAYPSITSASEKLHIDGSSISKVCRNKQKTAHGYVFKYLEEGSTTIRKE